MTVISRKLVELYDVLESLWEDKRTLQLIARVLITVFLASLLLIELSRLGLLPDRLTALLPTSHYYAINVAFSMLLGLEVFGLVFSLASSVSVSLGKQFEILSLILLRHSFKELVHFSEPLHWDSSTETVLHMLSNAGGGLVIFLLLGLYYTMQKHRPITCDPESTSKFIASKKIVSLLLLVLFSVIGVIDGIMYLSGTSLENFFSLFYTILLFSDVLLVLISLRYSSSYPIVFRNSGFAFATVLIRLALTAPPYYNVLIGIGAVVFAIGITFAYNRFEAPEPDDSPCG
ncbi:MAG: hypothetical protein C1942_10280 [Prosthecochloris sp.]|uniref:hypothetical protein n=1 Tax=Prosthecochloris sp. TaxID=290513 RepID=UPI0013CA742D|nr:hypothetical protein [Prosthecochloris sp.]NEX13047.1 hypothetical protein [Prosthecochloris sp.]